MIFFPRFFFFLIFYTFNWYLFLYHWDFDQEFLSNLKSRHLPALHDSPFTTPLRASPVPLDLLLNLLKILTILKTFNREESTTNYFFVFWSYLGHLVFVSGEVNRRWINLLLYSQLFVSSRFLNTLLVPTAFYHWVLSLRAGKEEREAIR